MTEYLKQAPLYSRAGHRRRCAATVSEMLLRDRRATAIDAIRRYSRELDGWDPASFVVDAATIDAAAAQIDPSCASTSRSRRSRCAPSPTAQRATLQRPRGRDAARRDARAPAHPGRHRRLLRARRALSDARVVVHDDRRPEGRRRRPRRRLRAAARRTAASTRRCSTRWRPRARTTILALGGVQALAAMALGIEGLPPADIIVGAGNAYVAEAKRQLFGEVGIDLLAGPTEIAVIADDDGRPGARGRRPARPGRARPDLAGRADHDLARRSAHAVLEHVERAAARRGRRGEVAGAAWEAHGSVAVVADLDEAIALADQIAPEHLEVQVADERRSTATSRGCATTARCSSGERRPSRTATRRIGTNHVLPTLRRGALHRRAVGRQVPQDLHLPAADRRGHAPRRAGGRRDLAPPSGWTGHALTATMRLDRGD